MAKSMLDLRTIDPKGRVDVLAFRGAETLTRFIEERSGISGLWDALANDIHDLVVKNVSGVELPREANLLLQIMQSNMGKGE